MWRFIMSHLPPTIVPIPMVWDTNKIFVRGIPKTAVLVYDLTDGHLVPTTDTRPLWSFAAMNSNAILVRTSTTDNSRRNIRKLIMNVLAVVRSSPGFGKAYTPAAFRPAYSTKWVEIGDEKILQYSVEFMYSTNGHAVETENFQTARQVKLDQHGQDTAVEVLKLRVGVNPELEWADGVSYARKSSIPKENGEPIFRISVTKGLLSEKVVDDPSHLTSPGRLVPGNIVWVTDKEFTRLGGKKDFDVVTAPDNIKIGEPGEFIGNYYLFPTARQITKQGVRKVSWTQPWTRANLTPRGTEVFKDGAWLAIEELKYVLKDTSGMAFLERTKFDPEESIPDAWDSFRKALAAGLPMTGREILDKILPIMSRKSGIELPFVWGTVIPDPALEEGQITIPTHIVGDSDWRYLQPGDEVRSAIRYPHLSTEVQDATIVGYNDTTCIGVNPTWWKNWFGGDFDGDTIGIFQERYFVPNRVLTPGKDKKKGMKTMADAVASYFQGTTMIGLYDSVLDGLWLALHRGLAVELDFAIQQVQAVIDGMKHDSDPCTYEEIRKYYKRRGVDLAQYKLDPIFRYFRGRVSSAEDMARVLIDTKSSAKTRVGYLLGDQDPISRNFPRSLVNKVNKTTKESPKMVLEEWIDFIPNHHPEAILLANRVLSLYGPKDKEGTFLYYRSQNDDRANPILREIKNMVSRPEADMAIKWLWANMVLMKPNFIRSLKMFAFFPANVGSWDLRAEVERIGRAKYKINCTPNPLKTANTI